MASHGLYSFTFYYLYRALLTVAKELEETLKTKDTIIAQLAQELLELKKEGDL
jgi:hypothetical protein